MAQAAKANPIELRSEKIDTDQVDVKIKEWRDHLTANKALAQEVAIMALTHCYQHRTAAKLRRVLEIVETEGKDFVRRAPLTLWYRKYAPVKMVTKVDDQGKKSKVLEFDAESTLLGAEAANITAASGKLWWTMSKDKEQDAWDIVRFDARMLGLCNQAMKLMEEDESVSAQEKSYVKKHQDFFKARVEAAKALAA